MMETEIEIRMIAHLPGVVLTDEGGPLAEGVVRAVSFSEWCILDQNFHEAGEAFEKTRPIFWDVRIIFECFNPDEGCAPTAQSLLNGLHRAFLIGPGQPWLPSPLLSSCYLRHEVIGDPSNPVQNETLRLLGPMEREWMLFGGELRVPYDASSLACVDALWRGLQATDGEIDPLSDAWATLERTARPDSWWGSNVGRSIGDFLQCIATCESLLSVEDSNLGKLDTFALRAAEFESEADSGASNLRAWWTDVYHLRTALIHGRIGFKTMSSDEKALLGEPRRLLARLVCSRLGLVEVRP